ncbi:MAG: DNA polymerase III subunit delta [Phycisphaerales bacterium]
MARRGGGKKKAATPTLDDGLRALILHGKENYLRVEYLRQLRDNIAEKRGEVDVIHFDGATATLADVLDEARSFGLMQQYKIVVLDDADQFLRIEEHRRKLERYMESPSEHATLVLRAETWRPGKLDKLVEKVGGAVKCELRSSDEAIAFCRKRCPKRFDCEIDADAAGLLVERVGASLSRLDAELARLSMMAEPGSPIDRSLIQREVGLSREEQAWEVQSALVCGDAAFALDKIRELVTVAKQPPVLIGYFITDLARKLYAASRLRADGMNDAAIAAELGLRWRAKTMVLENSRGVRPEAFADVLRDAVEIDVRNKSGLGNAERSLELLAVRFLTALPQSRR